MKLCLIQWRYFKVRILILKKKCVGPSMMSFYAPTVPIVPILKNEFEGEVKAKLGEEMRSHEYLGMEIDFTINNRVHITQTRYMQA